MNILRNILIVDNHANLKKKMALKIKLKSACSEPKNTIIFNQNLSERL